MGAAFVATRPFVVAPVAATNAALLLASGAPGSQRVALVVAFATALVAFAVERAIARRRVIGERWLGASLAATEGMLALGCALSGGVASPLTPLLAAPPTVALAAFGSGPRARRVLATAALAAVLLACADHALPFARPAGAAGAAMFVVSFAGLLALAGVGVASLVDAHVVLAETFDRMREATLDDASARMRAAENLGAKVAHELKNPLAAISGILQLLAEDDGDAKRSRRVEVALAESRRMEELLRDYLAFARPLSALEPQRIELARLAQDLVVLLEPRASARGIRLEVDGGPLVATADPRRLREVLLNLLGNALDASPSNATVAVRLARGHDAVEIRIEDEGSGVPPSIAEGLGGAFDTGTPGGHGLGLAIARAAVEQHGGSLRLEPRPCGGTMARVRLPNESAFAREDLR